MITSFAMSVQPFRAVEGMKGSCAPKARKIGASIWGSRA